MINKIRVALNSETVNTMILLPGTRNILPTGPCYQIAAVVDGLLCGLVGKFVARLEENCKWLWVDDFDRAGVGCGLA